MKKNYGLFIKVTIALGILIMGVCYYANTTEAPVNKSLPIPLRVLYLVIFFAGMVGAVKIIRTWRKGEAALLNRQKGV